MPVQGAQLAGAQHVDPGLDQLGAELLGGGAEAVRITTEEERRWQTAELMTAEGRRRSRDTAARRVLRTLNGH